MKNTSDNKNTLVSNSLKQIFSVSTIVCLAVFAISSIYYTFVHTSYFSETTHTLFQSLRTSAATASPYYVLYSNYNEKYIAVAVGLLLGFFQLSFLSDKNACYTRLSFGLKRKSMLLGNCFYPLAIAIFIVFVTKLFSAIANIYYVGLHVNIIKLFVYSFLSLVVDILFSFSVTAIASIITARKFESILLTACAVSLPSIISGIIAPLFSATLYGYGYANYNYYDSAIFNTLATADVTQTSSFYDTLEYFTCGVTENLPLATGIVCCVICICVCIGVLLFIANYFKKRFKPENCGKRGASKLSLTVISLTASSLIAATVLENTAYDNYTMSYNTMSLGFRMILCVILGTIAAVAINLLVMLGKKKLKYGFIGAGISVVMQLIIIIIGLTGCFGFSTEPPNIQNISSIEILIPFSDMFENDSNDYFSDADGYTHIGLTEAEDFKIIQNIHKTAIETKGEEETALSCEIKYTLKDGSTVSRYYYNISEETAAQYLKLWDTKAAKNYYKELLNQTAPDEITQPDKGFNEYFFNSYANMKTYGIPLDYNLIIVSKDNRTTELSSGNISENFVPTEKVKLEIMAALYKDICTLSAEEWFMPQEQYGALIFDTGSRYIATDSHPIFEDVFQEQNTVFYINSNMTNTVNVLKKYDYMRFFDCFKNIEQAHIVTADNLAKYLQGLSFISLDNYSEYVNNESVLHTPITPSTITAEKITLCTAVNTLQQLILTIY